MSKYYCKGREIYLNDQNFVTSGGEGSVYIENNDVFKVFHETPKYDFNKKLSELSILNKSPNKNILAPISPVLNENDLLIGFSMRYKDNTCSLTELFTNGFRSRHSITESMTEELINNIAETIQFIHEKDTLIVDCNEFNWLVDKKDLIMPYAIDVDSYQTKNFPATAIMPSIQDPKTFGNTNFNKGSDWYSFAILCFQLMTGIHPFKGKHISKMSMQDRMKNGISIFNKSVSYPKSVRDPSLIPNEWRNWYSDTFEKHNRTKPPLLKLFGAKQPSSTIKTYHKGSDHIRFVKELVDEKTKWILSIPKKGLFKYGNKGKPSLLYIGANLYKEVNIILDKEKLLVKYNEETTLVSDNIRDYFIYKNKLYTINKDFVISWYIQERDKGSGVKELLVVKNKEVKIFSKASKAYGNCVYNNVYGKCYITIPLETGETGGIVSVNIKELERKKILDMQYEKGFLLVLSFDSTKGEYETNYIKFNHRYPQNYTITTLENEQPHECNMCVIDNRNMVIIYDETQDRLTLTLIGDINTKHLENCGLSGQGWTLGSNGSKVVVFGDKGIQQIELK